MVLGYSSIIQYFQTYGILDFLLPFLLVFTIVFAVLQRINIFGEDKKNFNVIISLVLALTFIVPHMTGSYPLGYDPVMVLNEALPSISLVAVASVMLLLLLGIFSGSFVTFALPLVAVIAVVFVIYIFGATSALNLWSAPHDLFFWWTQELTELLLIILIFGGITYLIIREPKKEGEKTSLGRLGDVLGKLVKKE